MTDVAFFPAGQVVAEGFVPGDFFLVCDWNPHVTGKLIRAGARIRYGNVDLARWSHAGMIIATDGSIVEAESKGVQLNNISKYTDANIYVVHPPASIEQRSLACAFAKLHVGDPYDFFDIIGLAIQVTFGVPLSLHAGARYICSGLVSRCTEKYIVGYPRSVEQMMPADLAAYWGVETGQPLPDQGWFDKFLNFLAMVTRPIRSLRRRLQGV